MEEEKTALPRSNRDKRAWRISIYTDTKRIVSLGNYTTPDGTHVTLPSLPTNDSLLVTNSNIPDFEPRKYPDMRVFIYEGDCVEAGIRMQDCGFNVTVLNMASAFKPGGGVKHGAGAQEEGLFRRSNYHLHLCNHPHIPYPLPPNSGIYTPQVTYFRASEAYNYTLLPTPRLISMLAVPAIRHPKLTKIDRNYWLNENDFSLAKEKIRLMLRIAIEKGHNAVVLSAWGCGAYGNPPLCIATAFKSVLEENYFLAAFERVIFAIFDDKNARKAHNPDGNLAPFSQIFGVPISTSLLDLA